MTLLHFLQDLTHKNDGLYDVSNWEIDQTSFLANEDEAVTKKKVKIKKKDTVKGVGGEAEMTPLVKKSDQEVGMEEIQHKVDDRASLFLGEKTTSPSRPLDSPKSPTKVTYNPMSQQEPEPLRRTVILY